MTAISIPTKLPLLIIQDPIRDESAFQVTWTKLLRKIGQAITTRKKLICKFKGSYHDPMMRKEDRSLSYWESCNPGIYKAIQETFTDLEAKGWKPTMMFDRSKHSRKHQCWYGGTTIRIVCDFRYGRLSSNDVKT